MRKHRDGQPVLSKTTKVCGKDYFMTVYETGDGYFSKDGTVSTALPLAELEPNPDARQGANQQFQHFSITRETSQPEWEYAK